VPEGQWYGRFSGMTVCGEGGSIKTFLLPAQAPKEACSVRSDSAGKNANGNKWEHLSFFLAAQKVYGMATNLQELT